MLTLLLLMLFSLILAMILNTASSILSFKSLEDQDKLSPFECGFDPLKNTRMPFSLRFFLITIIFLIFDVEITLILPLISNFSTSNLNLWIMISLPFLMILIIGIIHEWNQGMLNWN
uniref:NADH-ubiquinone oxidoreductase chain 3 n=1 Tax=Lepinotus reticulatus TaxID=209981 RepID=A0A3S8IEB8_9NEOP|nr:NADH dehydrogenase subunit 3 [Lepinotus reticulatus]